MITYKLVEENHNDNILGFYTSFGIKAIENLSDSPLVYVEDVFTDIETAQEYISLFNEEQLESVLIVNKPAITDSISVVGGLCVYGYWSFNL